MARDVTFLDTSETAGRTALMYAASGPFQRTVLLLLENKAAVNLQDRQEHWTALMVAAGRGHTDVVQTLLDYHADNTLKDVDGDTALSFAQRQGHGDVVRLIKKMVPQDTTAE